ncbi:prepilin-type N-terminal cleavage/methylation domain-containing protein [Pseudobacillus wudalianchiensis]|uniref:Prepilin-type N-terminal cleavage/methylation domain-containing protein n=1 Tax=Pseudobacillus wudalianchiensis TaxID=1743143 RepID=A0A1B9B8J4_9BACI|nr:prepilin-type N-terminal cleavage/methylation domain-containing protein [Bacillus wudalianchiensis]OCA92400.1 hypothetical protein A8F95_01400 [Bacillus wudalianchiensis]
MIATIKQRLKDQKGLTLIELLAVVVILAIIAAIAIPAIGGLIDNTKKDAHIANAQQMVNSAKTAIASEKELTKNSTIYLSMQYLEDKGYLEPVEDPDGTASSGYAKGSSSAAVTTAPAATTSYVEITKNATTKSLTYKVNLVGSERKIATSELKDIDRNDVVAK